MDTLSSIDTFRQVVESGSFVAAAERLEVSPATVSKRIMHVEERLGVRLLNRNTRKLSLTDSGRLYFERCKTILEDLHATELELGSERAPRGTLRLTCRASPPPASCRRCSPSIASAILRSWSMSPSRIDSPIWWKRATTWRCGWSRVRTRCRRA